MKYLSKIIRRLAYGLPIVLLLAADIGVAKPAPVLDHSFKGNAKKRTYSKPAYKKVAPAPRKTKARSAQRVVSKSKPSKVVTPSKPQSGYVTVKKGQTLYALSRQYDVNVKELIKENRLRSPYTLAIGQKIKLPRPTYHIVRKGETVYGISRAYNMDMNRLVSLNHVKRPYTLSIGQKLVVNKIQVSAPVRVASKKKLISPVRGTTKKKVIQTASLTRKPVVKKSSSNRVPKKVPKRPVSKQAPARSSKYFSWPVKGNVISNYGPKKNGLHNDGINIRAPKGASVLSSENGIVEYVGGMKGFDNLVIIKHQNYMTAYAHLGKIAVNRGAKVKKGQSIGTVGVKAKIPQIHFEIRKGKKAINPVTLLR